MEAWLDFLLLALALGAGWLGWVLLTLAGWRPGRRAAVRGRSSIAQAGGLRRATNSRAADG